MNRIDQDNPGVVWIERCFLSPFNGRMYADARMTVTEEDAQRLLTESAGQRKFWRVIEKPFEMPQTELALI